MALTGRAVWDTYLANNLLAGDGITLTPDTNLRQTTIAVRVADGGGLVFVDGELTADVTAIGVVAATPDTIPLRDTDGSLAMTIAVLGEFDAPNLGTLGRDADGRLSVHVDGGPKVVPVAGDYQPAWNISGDLDGTEQTPADGDVCLVSSLLGDSVKLPAGGATVMTVYVYDIEAAGGSISVDSTGGASIGNAAAPYSMNSTTNHIRKFFYMPGIENWTVFTGL